MSLIFDSRRYFEEVVEEAFTERKFTTYPQVKTYLAEVLKYYLITENLFDTQDSSGRKTRTTLAEQLLHAQQMGQRERFERLKRLGDSSLYISGFFSDSLQRKIIDVDYYVDMGRLAFDELSTCVEEDTFSKLYKEIAIKFVPLIDVLSFISQRMQMTNGENILRIMDVYAKTGSSWREEALLEKGVFNSATKNQNKQ